MSQKPPLVIYHGNCADGFGAAWVFSRYGRQPFDFFPGVYQKPPPDVIDRNVILVDFSYRREVVEKMLETARTITLIDHHKSALEDLEPLMRNGTIATFCSMEHSGAVLAWDFLHGAGAHEGKLMPRLLRHIEDRDLWRFALPYTREIQANVFSYPYDFKVWDDLMYRDIDDLIAAGKAIERKHHKDIAELVGVTLRRMMIGGHYVPVANVPYTMASDAGHLMAEKEPFAASYYDSPDGRNFSLRSREDGMDVSAIAKLYGGGGHAHAAGFRVSFADARLMEFKE
jgi:oligoribonuclease NrnB/cAMP/cGMP phosphodiesterase (DHH superfamily)